MRRLLAAARVHPPPADSPPHNLTSDSGTLSLADEPTNVIDPFARRFRCVFLVPSVSLVDQQTLAMHEYMWRLAAIHGMAGADTFVDWNARMAALMRHHVTVMTPQIFLFVFGAFHSHVIVAARCSRARSTTACRSSTST